MKNFKPALALVLLMLTLQGISQTAQITNTAQEGCTSSSPNQYFIGAFNTIGISGACPTTPSVTSQFDIPDGGTSFHTSLEDEAGNPITDCNDISGITIQEWLPAGATYVVEFCVSGSWSPFGTTMAGPYEVNWAIFSPTLMLISINCP